MLYTLPRQRLWIRLAVAWLICLSLLTAYWLRLNHSHQAQLAEAEQRAQLRASQAAHALSMQVRAQFMSIDFVLEHLSEHWFDHDEAVFRKLIALAKHSIFKDSLDLIAVADSEGRVLFSSRTELGQPPHLTSIAERSYFKQLAQSAQHRFVISPPIKNALSQRWTVQFSHNMLVDGQFSGVIVAAIPAEQLADALKQVYPAKDDVVLLTLNDGHYLARTHALEDSLGKKVPDERDFIQQPETFSGHYTVVAPIDDVERFYAWHRIPDFPVVLSLGLGKNSVLAPTLSSIQHSRTQSLLGTTLLLLAALWITRLVLIKAKQNRALLQNQERLATLLKRISAGVLLEDEKRHIVMVNKELCSLLQLDLAPHQLTGLHHSQLLSLLKPEQAWWFSTPENKTEQRHLHEVADSKGRTYEIDWVPIQRDFRFLGHVWFMQDISSRKQKELELMTLATTDALTGLHNRRSFLDILQHQISLSQAHAPGALLLLDIDHFKRVNDTYGHPVGDQVIHNVAQAIRDSLRQGDFTGRLGGEEFAVLLPKVTQSQALLLAERIRECIATTPTLTPSDSLFVTISIGVALLYEQTEISVQEHADQALYRAKNLGRNRVCFAEHTAEVAQPHNS